jgi:3-carboxy-cis,cis-muconate cycloisomerase
MGDSADLIDSVLLGDSFSSPDVRRVFADHNILQKWLDVEAALAESQAELGIVPLDAANEIRRHANADQYDLSAIGREIESISHPLVPVIRALERACDGDAGQYVHWGATTQDITDTGTVLLAREALTLIEDRVDLITGQLMRLASLYRDTIMPGRTHGQHGPPITLGFKFAILIDEFDRHCERIGEARKRVFVGQLAGAVGSLASMGGAGLEVQERLMARLGLATPNISWHTARDRLTELVSIVSMIAATTGKIANEVRVLQATEVNEVREPYSFGKVGSSTMPHKRNPMVAENVIAAVRLTRQSVPMMLESMIQEHERDMTAWGVEWSVLPDVFALTGGALDHCIRILEGLRVNPDAMRRNLNLQDGLNLSEAVMMHLAGPLGKQRAHEVVYEASMRAYDDGVSIADALNDVADVRANIDAEQMKRLLDPKNNIGLCREFVDRVLALHQKD